MKTHDLEMVISVPSELAEVPPFERDADGGFTQGHTRMLAGLLREAWEKAGEPALPAGPYQLETTAHLPRPARHLKADGTLTAAGRASARPMRAPGADNVIALIEATLKDLGALPGTVPLALLLRRKVWSEDGEARIVIEARTRAGEGFTQIMSATR